MNAALILPKHVEIDRGETARIFQRAFDGRRAEARAALSDEIQLGRIEVAAPIRATSSRRSRLSRVAGETACPTRCRRAESRPSFRSP
jgi:hypothetical protein